MSIHPISAKIFYGEAKAIEGSKGSKRYRIQLTDIKDQDKNLLSFAVSCSIQHEKPKLKLLQKRFNVILMIKDGDDTGYVIVNKNSLKKRLGLTSAELEQTIKENKGDVTTLVNKHIEKIIADNFPDLTNMQTTIPSSQDTKTFENASSSTIPTVIKETLPPAIKELSSQEILQNTDILDIDVIDFVKTMVKETYQRNPKKTPPNVMIKQFTALYWHKKRHKRLTNVKEIREYIIKTGYGEEMKKMEELMEKIEKEDAVQISKHASRVEIFSNNRIDYVVDVLYTPTFKPKNFTAPPRIREEFKKYFHYDNLAKTSQNRYEAKKLREHIVALGHGEELEKIGEEIERGKLPIKWPKTLEKTGLVARDILKYIFPDTPHDNLISFGAMVLIDQSAKEIAGNIDPENSNILFIATTINMISHGIFLLQGARLIWKTTSALEDVFFPHWKAFK